MPFSKGAKFRGLGDQPQGPGAGTMEKGIVASRGLSQITKLEPPGGRRGAKSGPLEKGIVASGGKIQRSQTQGPGGQPQGHGAGRGPWKKA